MLAEIGAEMDPLMPQTERDGGPGGAVPPVGLIAMLFIDIEGSTRMAASLGEEWGEVLGAYHAIVRGIVGSHAGYVDESAGDGFFVTFDRVSEAGRAAVAIQQALHAHPWPPAANEVKARMGLHVGQVERHPHGYIGLEIHRAARVGAAAHGGELLLSGIAAEMLRDSVPSQPLGAHRLKDFPVPIALFCAVIDGRGAGAFPPPRTLELRAGNLPVLSLDLVGRERDLERVRAALDGQRLVTLLGRGGVGKTSLALATAHEVFEEYAGGVWWIDVSQERDGAGLYAAIARGCRSNAQGPAEQALAADLESRGRLLLVLDNLEQVPSAGEVVDGILARLPDVSVLATSQLPLRCALERRLELDRLSESDALALLAQAAERLDVPLGDDPATSELIALLDGLPLAIELAAARLRVFGPAELVARLRDSTAILKDPARPGHQRSLGAALEWTLGLLAAEARELFTRLGVFAGPVELETIERVVGEGLDAIEGLDTLLDASLLRRVERGDGLVRFGFPEAIRQEAARALDGQTEEGWRRAHAVWQRDLVWPMRIFEIVDSRLVARADGTAAETHAALAWAWDHEPQLAREIALGRYSLAHRAGAAQEARELLDRVIADPGEEPAVLELLRHQVIWRQGPSGDERVQAYIALLSELRDPYARFLCTYNIAIGLAWAGRFDETISWLERARELGREIGSLAEASALALTASIQLDAGHDAEAEATLHECEAIAGTRSNRDTEMGEIIRAALASKRSHHADALDRFGRLLTRAETAGDMSSIIEILGELVLALARAGYDGQTLEATGIGAAIEAELTAHGESGLNLMPRLEPEAAAAIARLGPEGRERLDAGRAVPAAERVKRLTALIYENQGPAG